MARALLYYQITHQLGKDKIEDKWGDADLSGGLDCAVDILGLSFGNCHQRLSSAGVICLEGLAARSILKFAVD